MESSRSGQTKVITGEANRLVLNILSQEIFGDGGISVFIALSNEPIFYTGFLSKIYGYTDRRVIAKLSQDAGFSFTPLADASKAKLHQLVNPDMSRSLETVRRARLFLMTEEWERNRLFVKNPPGLYRLNFSQLVGVNWLVNHGMDRNDVNKSVPPLLQTKVTPSQVSETVGLKQEIVFDPLVALLEKPKYLRKIGEDFRTTNLVPNYRLAQDIRPTILIGRVGQRARRRRLNKGDYKRDKSKFDRKIKRSLGKLTEIYASYGYNFRFGAFVSEVVTAPGYPIFSVQVRKLK